MAVPLLDIVNHNRPYFARMREAFNSFIESGQYIGGDHVTGFEKELAEYLKVKECIAVSSGTDALLLALMTLGIKAGDEVICPSFTFFATGGVIHRLGATPVFADMLPGSFNIDPEDIERKITSRTKAIVPVHIFGQMADMDRITDIANQHHLPILEDAAQAIGATHRGKKAGTIGTFGAFSFYPTKNLSGFGDGGFLATNDEALAKHARILRIHGMDPVYYHSEVGGNFRFDPFQGMLLRMKLPDVDEQNSKREENASYYRKRLGEHASIALSVDAADDATIVLPETSPANVHIWHQFTLRVRGEGKRDALFQWLRDREIGCGIYYPLGLHQQMCFKTSIPDGYSLPETEQATKEVLSIPIFPELTTEQLDEVCDAILSFVDA